MTTHDIHTTALALLVLSWACNGDQGDESAGLFGDGGSGPPVTTDSTGGTTQAQPGSTDTSHGEDDAPPPTTATTSMDSSSGEPATGSDSSDGGTTGSTGDGSSTGDTGAQGDLDVQVTVQSMFPQGQCDDVLVTNISALSVTWEIELPLPGTIDQLWNAEVVEMPGSGVFTGVAFNATLDPAEQAMFGYCVLY